MTEVVIAGAVRSPQGNLGGALKDFTNQDIGKLVVGALLEKNKVDPAEVDEVIVGCVGQNSDATNVARVIALTAGLAKETPAYTVNRNCGSGLQAVVSALQSIEMGDAELIIAGGVEVMSQTPYVNRDLRFGKRIRHSQMIDAMWESLTDPTTGLLMGETAEILAEELGISRNQQDEYALYSHQRAIQATREGRFKDEIVTVTQPKKKSKQLLQTDGFYQDENINPNLNLQILAQYPPTFKESGTVTSGNSCPISDGAAAVIVTTKRKALDEGLEIFGVVRGYGFAGVEPERMGIGPVHAIPLALKKARLGLQDIQLFEINESFASQYLAVEKLLDLDREIVNVNGGAIALGHPVGATGTRLLVTLLHEMRRRDLRKGLVSMCIGGGQGGAMIVERI